MKKHILSQSSMFSIILPFFIITGCCNFGVNHISEDEWLEEKMTNALNSSSLSQNTINNLKLAGCYDIYQEEPADAILKMKELYASSKRASYAAALAEMCYLQGKEDDDIKYYVSSFIFAYQFFGNLPDKERVNLSPQNYFMTRYLNFSIMEIFKFLKERKLVLAGEFQLPSVYGNIPFKKAKIPKNILDIGIDHLMPSCQLQPYGFESKNYTVGLGLPLAAELNFAEEISKGEDIIFHPTTLMIFLKMKNGHPLNAQMEFLDPLKTETVPILDKKYPLETDLTTTIAEALSRPPLIKGIEFMIYPEEIHKDGGLYLAFEYDPEKIPIVFVHGLMSNPRTWTKAFNTLLLDPQIRKRYQFWFFAYATGDPVVYSAALLRKALLRMQTKYSPQGQNKNFNRMVIIAHSMGGLVSSLMVKNSDQKLIDNLIGIPVDELDLPVKQKNFLLEMLVFEKLPFIQRVIFISVPHRGSDLASYDIVTQACKYIALPTRLSSLTGKVCHKILVKAKLKDNDDVVFMTTGVNNLDPSNKTLSILENMPYDSRAVYHTLSGDYFGFRPLPGSSDGIVPYWSSHLDNVVSEKVVTSGHGVQDTNAGIEEIHRILLEHLSSVPN